MKSSAPGDQRPLETDAAVASLIATAGPRPRPAASIEASVREAVEREWNDVADSRRRARSRIALLAAAVVAAVVGLTWLAVRQELGASPAVVGTLVASRGPVRIETERKALIAVGDSLASGTAVRTGAGAAAALSIANVAVRVGPETVVELDRPGQVRLVSGRVYVDSGPSRSRAGTLSVRTPFGSITHLGTQFQVQVDAGKALSVSVREGRVRVELSHGDQTVVRGEGLRVLSTGAVMQLAIEPYDATWSWVSDIVPDFSIEGRPLSAFLDWFARETGRTLVFVPPATRAGADRTTLNGTISGLTPVEALDAVLATTRFRYDVAVPGQVRVRLRANGDDRPRTTVDSTAVPVGPAGSAR